MIHNLIFFEAININFPATNDNWWKIYGPIIAAMITGGATIISAFFAIWGVRRTINSNQNLKNKELLNSLDQKSEWRKELMNIAAKPSISTKDVYRVLASLRFLPKTKIEIYGKKVNKKCVNEKKINNFLMKNKDKDFDVISNYIYNKLINKYIKKTI